MKLSYLSWICSNLNLFEYQKDYSYNQGDQVIVGSTVYESLISNNLNNNPLNSPNWIKLL